VLELRAALEEQVEAIRSHGPKVRAELRELGRELGPARDADVFAAYLREEAESMDGDAPALDLLIARVEDERQSAYAAARAAIDAPGHLRLLEKLSDFVATAEIAEGRSTTSSVVSSTAFAKPRRRRAPTRGCTARGSGQSASGTRPRRRTRRSSSNG
jgi:CHAD domain-containing protein